MYSVESTSPNSSLLLAAAGATVSGGAFLVSKTCQVAWAALSITVELATQAAPHITQGIRVAVPFACNQIAAVASGIFGFIQQAGAPLLSAKVLVPLGLAGVGVTVIALTAVVLISPARGVVIGGSKALVKLAAKVLTAIPKALATILRASGTALKGLGKGVLKLPGKMLHLTGSAIKGLVRVVGQTVKSLLQKPGKLLRSGIKGILSLPSRIAHLVPRAFKALWRLSKSLLSYSWKFAKSNGERIGGGAKTVARFLWKHHNLFLYLGALATSSALLVSSGLVVPQLALAGLASRVALEALLWYRSPILTEGKDDTQMNPFMAYSLAKLTGGLECPDITGLNQNKRFVAITAAGASVALAKLSCMSPEFACFGLAFQVASLALACPFQAVGKPFLNASSKSLDHRFKLGSALRGEHPWFLSWRTSS